MSRGSHQITQRDITFWGVSALACGMLAILAGNLGGMVPPNLAAALQGTRMGTGNLTELRYAIDANRQDAADLAAANQELTARFDLIDAGATQLIGRVAAVERSVPLLIEALPASSDIDRSLLTAAIGGDAEALQQVEGGLMSLSQRPLIADSPPAQPLPPPVEEDDAVPAEEPALPVTQEAFPAIAFPDDSFSSFAIDLGVVASDRAVEEWDALIARVGPLLLGLEPRVMLAGGEAHLVAGPFPTQSAAATVCERLDRVGTPCSIASFGGTAVIATPPVAGENG